MEQGVLRRKAQRIHCAAAALAIEVGALVQSQLLNFKQVKIDGVKATVAAGAVGKSLCHIRGAVQMDIVQYDGDAIPAQHHILLQEVGSHGVGQRLGGERVLRQIPAGKTKRAG